MSTFVGSLHRLFSSAEWPSFTGVGAEYGGFPPSPGFPTPSITPSLYGKIPSGYPPFPQSAEVWSQDSTEVKIRVWACRRICRVQRWHAMSLSERQ